MEYVINRGRLEDMDIRQFIRNYVQQPGMTDSPHRRRYAHARDTPQSRFFRI